MDRNKNKKWVLGILIFCLSLAAFLPLLAGGPESDSSLKNNQKISDHFNGSVFFNPGLSAVSSSSSGNSPNRGMAWYLWRWLFSDNKPVWPYLKMDHPLPPPPATVPYGTLRITPVGHSTFLIQMDKVNILTDPIWSERCSPVSWAGPKRHQPPGIRFEDLPSIDVILISHNHYDHLDLPTLRRLAEKGTDRAVVPLGDIPLVKETGISQVEELDWWQSINMAPEIKITLVPAKHFSGRTPWDRNKTLWGGFVISGPSGNVYYSGDTGYGPHFKEIARRFSPIRVALLPLSPFRTKRNNELTPPRFSVVHMGPDEAVKAHLDLKAERSIAAHFRVFQLGWNGFDDAVIELALALKKENLRREDFVAPFPGQVIELKSALAESLKKNYLAKSIAGRN